jgi:hypothetical protein
MAVAISADHRRGGASIVAGPAQGRASDGGAAWLGEAVTVATVADHLGDGLPVSFELAGNGRLVSNATAARRLTGDVQESGRLVAHTRAQEVVCRGYREL